MGLSLTVLGCCGSYPGPGGACSGYLVEGGGVRVWFDSGNGTMANLQLHAGLAEVDAIVLSHNHPDHWADIEGFYVWARYLADRRGVQVYAPRDVRPVTPAKDMAPHLVWHAVRDGDRVDIDGLAVTFSRTDHGPETLGCRVEGDGRVLGYSADSGPGWSLAALGPGLDLALCEATPPSHQEGKVPGHMSARQAGASAREAGAARLVLTHLWPTVDPATAGTEGADAFGRDVTVACHHDRYEV